MTLRELVWMSDGKNDTDWNHTASMMTLLANINRDPKKHPAYTITDFHPMRTKKKEIGDIRLLKSAFTRRKGKK